MERGEGMNREIDLKSSHYFRTRLSFQGNLVY